MTPISSAAEFSALRMISTVMGSARLIRTSHTISHEVTGGSVLRRDLPQCRTLDKALLLAHGAAVSERTVRVELAVMRDHRWDSGVLGEWARSPHQHLRVRMARLPV